MSDQVALHPPLLRLPRELRNSVFTHAFPPISRFPDNWSGVDTSKNYALFGQLPGVCRVSRQLLQEATPTFLNGCYIYSWNTETIKHLLEFYSHFRDDEVTKCAKEFGIFEWTEEGTSVQLELTTKFTNLESLEITFSFPGIVDGTPMDEFDYANEQYYWQEAGLHYAPPEDRSVEEKKAILARDVEAFVTAYGLDRIIEMPKLKNLTFQTDGSGELYRHRLCNPLWRWATRKMKGKWGVDESDDGEGIYYVSTFEAEDYDRIMGS